MKLGETMNLLTLLKVVLSKPKIQKPLVFGRLFKELTERKLKNRRDKSCQK